MARLNIKSNSKGFSLVELLIVVAIIGVLATIGVPTFRRMVTKAKQAEGKSSLAGLYTVESAFQTEYNSFGNHLTRIGYELDGNTRRYSVGFPLADCTSQPQTPTDAPTLAAIVAAYPQYTALGLNEVPDAAGAISRTVYHRSIFVGGAEACAVPVAMTDTGTTFQASATGNISPGLASNASAVAACVNTCQDVWTIDDQRNLVNLVSGIN